MFIRLNYKKFITKCIIISFISLFFASSASAHEIYYSGSSPNWVAIPLVWDERSSGKAYLKMNGDLLSSDYSSNYITVSNVWPNASSKVTVLRTTFSNSKVDLATASETYWDNRFGSFWGRYVGGVCDITSTDGIQITSASTAKNSSGRIRYAGILLTPYIDDYYESGSNRTNHIRATMVHEIGHALGLGHPNASYYPTSDASIMRTAVGYEGYYTPRPHDINDLSNKY